MSSEVYPVESFLVSRLASTPLSVYRMPAPDTASYPVIVYSVTPLRDVVYTDKSIALTVFEAAVFAVGRGPIVELKTAVDAIQAALHGQTNVTVSGGWTVAECRRTLPFRQPPYQIGDYVYQEIGGRYEIAIYKMPP
jgi:hypothetical protein